MHTIACARSSASTCSCVCNHTLHGYLSGVLSHEQHRRVTDPIAKQMTEASEGGSELHADRALHELNKLLGSARGHLESGALDTGTLASLVGSVLDAAADQRSADEDRIAAAELVAVDAAAVADANAQLAEQALAESDVAQALLSDEVDAEVLATQRANLAEAQRDEAIEFAEATERDANERVALAEAERDAALDAARQAERDADERAAFAELQADSVVDAAAIAVANAQAEELAAEAEARGALEREARAESTTAWALGQMHLLCGVCVAGVNQIEDAEVDAAIALSDFLELTFGPASANPLHDDRFADLLASMELALGEDVTASLMSLESLPSATDLRVLAVAFCPDPTQHPEVAGYQADLTDLVVRSLSAAT